MKTTVNPIGTQRHEPAACEIGDWILAAEVTDWNANSPHGHILIDPGGGREMAFKLLPYVDGKRQVVWIRIG